MSISFQFDVVEVRALPVQLEGIFQEYVIVEGEQGAVKRTAVVQPHERHRLLTDITSRSDDHL